MKVSRRGAVIAGTIAFFLPFVTFTAHAAPATKPLAATGITTQIDWAIDAYIAATANAATADLRIAREQMQFQFQALSAAEQQKVIAAGQASSETAAANIIQALRASMQNAATTAFNSAKGVEPKLGGIGPDQVFVPTANPCRVEDSRNGPGQLASVSARQVYTMSTTGGYSWAADQGGTGNAGVGNCVGTVYSGTPPSAVVAIVSIVNTSTAGALQAWNGGTTLSGGAVLNWLAGERLSNTTVIQMSRSISSYPGSGVKRDIAVYNNSGGPVDFVIDVVGYFIENTATPLDCVTATSTSPVLGIVVATCPSGYSETGGGCTSSSIHDHTYAASPDTATTFTCGFWPETGFSLGATLTAYARCCRVPGL